MIRVYDSTERIFDHNGIKSLSPLRADITKVDNGDYYCELEDTIANLDYYQCGLIVRVPTPWGFQCFRLTNPNVQGNKVSVKAWHITYDARNYIVKDAYAVDKDCNEALAYFNARTDIPSPFQTVSDITGILSSRAVRRTLFEIYSWMASEEKYGGHWYRDNWTFGIKARCGEDRGVVLSVGKNITSLEVSENWDDVCTKLLPYTTADTATIMLDETYLELTEGLYDIPYTKIVKFENALDMTAFETEEEYHAATKNWLRGQAQTYLMEHSTPKVNYKVSASIDRVSDVGDTIRVKHPKCKVDILTEVISVEYDAIRRKYTQIEFGNFKNELKNLKETIKEEVNDHTDEVVKEAQSLMQTELEESTNRITGVLGNSYVINEGSRILVVDALPKETAANVMMISSGGIGFSNTGINGTFTSAWTLDGKLDMQKINVINFTASLIKGGTLKLGGVGDTNGTFELYDETNTLISLMDKDGWTVYAKNGDFVKLNAVDGFVGYDSRGEKVYWADGDTFHMVNAEIENQIKIAGKIKVVPVTTAGNVGVGFVAMS